jgi:hypothetical protein
MPDNFEYKVADALAADVERGFDQTDLNRDGRLRIDELTVASHSDGKTVDAVFRAAANRLVEDYIGSCGHKEKLVFNANKDLSRLGAASWTIKPELTKDLTVPGAEVTVVDRSDLTRWRQSFKEKGQLQEALPKPIDKDFVQIVRNRFDYLDTNKDKKLTLPELKRMEEVAPNAPPSSYVGMAAAKYVEGRLQAEGQTENYTVSEKVSEAGWVRGPDRMLVLPTGKSVILIRQEDPGHHVPAKYEQVVKQQRFVTRDDLERWER